MSTTDKNYIISQIANIVNADANGAIVSLNTSSYTANLGPVGNVTITGGSAGQSLTTNGNGTLSWTTVSTNNVANANYAAYAGNVTIAAQSNITSVGTLSSLTVGGVSNLNTVGNLRITGGSNGQMLTTNGIGSLSWATANVTSSTQVGQFGLFLSTPPDSTWLPASTGPYLVSSYPALGALLGTPTVTTQSSSVNSILSSSCFGYGGGRYIVIYSNDGSTNIMASKYSTDGITWTTGGSLPDYSGYWNGRTFVWNGSVFFVTDNGSGSVKAVTSPDGVTWTPRTLPTGPVAGDTYVTACVNGSTIVTMTSSGFIAKSTDNGATWTSSSGLPSGVYLPTIAYGGGKYIVLRYNSNIGYYSTDLVTWTAFTLPRVGNWWSAAHNGSYWIMGTDAAESTMAMSYDGINWSSIPTPVSNTAVTKLIWNGSRWIYVDATNNLLRWTQDVWATWSSTSIAAGAVKIAATSDGAGNSVVVWNFNNKNSYKYTFTAASTFSVGSGPVSVSRGTWWIKS